MAKSLTNLQKEFNYWKEVRNFVVNAPMNELGGTVIAQRICRLVIEKMHSVEKEARDNKYITMFEDLGWSSAEKGV